MYALVHEDCEHPSFVNIAKRCAPQSDFFRGAHKAVQQAYLANYASLTKASGAMVGAFGLRLIIGTIQEMRKRAE